MRAVAVLALLLALAAPLGAETALPLPVCPSCDCAGDCFTWGCQCEGKVDERGARDLLAYATAILDRLLGGRLALSRPVEVEAVGQERLRLPDGEQALGLYAGDRILVGRWLRRSEALMVLAHEYGHAWQDQFHAQPPKLTDRFSEGFASWVAHVVARRTGYVQEATRLCNRGGKTYGEGLEQFLEWERTLGVDRLLELATQWDDFSGAGLRQEP